MTIPTSRPATPFPTPTTLLRAPHETPVSKAVAAQRVRKPKAALSIADQPILEALGRYRALTYEQCGRVLGITTAAAGRRMRDLIHLGVVEKAPFRINGIIWVGLTRHGLEEVGLEPRRQPWSIATMQHTWWVAEIGLELEEQGHRPVSDRELVANAKRNKAGRSDPLAIKTPSGQHFADLRYCTRDTETAIEVQLTRKPRSEFERIIRAYAQDRSITHVRYLVASPSLAQIPCERGGIDTDHRPRQHRSAWPTHAMGYRDRTFGHRARHFASPARQR